MTERIVVLIDMDCFYCQVEERLNPLLKGKPMAVVQYNTWKGGGIIAVNYEARDFGVTRHVRGNEAKEKCKEIVLVTVPEVRGKADLTKYRDAGREVVNVLSQFSDCVERASVDEAYIDLTQTVETYIKNMETALSHEQLPNTFVVGYSEENNNDEAQRVEGIKEWIAEQMSDPACLRLAVAGVIVEEIRAAVYTQTEFRCSAGIGHNKVLGKLVCGLHKPNRQTILPHGGVAELYRTLSVKKVRHLGGKLGDSVMEQLGCKVMADLELFTEAQLQAKFDTKTGSWLFNIARGIDHDPVTPRLLAKSIGCCKNFKGNQALISRDAVEQWTLDLSRELTERLEKDQEENKRTSKLLTVSFVLGDNSATRSGPFNSYDVERIAADAMELIRKSNEGKWSLPIKYLGLSAGKFVEENSNQNTIQSFFKTVDKVTLDIKHDTSLSSSESVPCSTSASKTKKNDENQSFFMKYFKKQDDLKAVALKMNASLESVATTSENNHNKVDNKIENECRDGVIVRKEAEPLASCSKAIEVKPLPSCSNAIEVFEENSDSNCSVLWTSLGEIFPDITVIDDSVASLLPPSMQKQLEARRNIANSSHDDLESSKQNELQSINIASTSESDSDSIKVERTKSDKMSEPNQRVVAKNYEPEYDPFYGDDSTDVDDDVAQIIETETNTSVQTAASTSEEVARKSTTSDNNIPGQLCKKCSKYILLHVYLEHLDFHAAEDLHKELNVGPVTVPRSVPVVAANKKSPAKSLPGAKKRGRPSKSSLTKTSDKKMRSINSYFTPKK